jgi:flagellar hook assembly protein FlgD
MLIEIAVFDLLGRKVIDLFKAKQAAGFYQIRWDGKNENGIFVPSGIYFCRIKTKEFTKTQKMIFMR